MTQDALARGFSAYTVVDDGLIAGMAVVGIKFRDNIIFVPEALVAARAMKAGMAHNTGAAYHHKARYGPHRRCL